MAFLVLGVSLWFFIHIFPSIFIKPRLRLLDLIGLKIYQAIFSILLLTSFAIIIYGWKSTTPLTVYDLSDWGKQLNWILMLVALIFFMSGIHPTNLKRFIRHPMLLGVATWAFGHLLVNGDIRSIILFGGMGAWSLLSIVTINRRDGDWLKPKKVPIKKDAITISIAIIMYVVLLFAHPYLSGVKIIAI